MGRAARGGERMVILCDLDSIVADLLGAWLPAYNEAHGRSVKVDDILGWEMHEHVPDGHRVYDILHRPGLFRGLAPLAGALDGLTALHKAGHHVVLLTASAKRPETASDKLSWVREHLPWLDRKDVIIGHRKYLVRGDVLIDDSPTNIREYREAWPEATIITIDYPYNRGAEIDGMIQFRALGYSDTGKAWTGIVDFLAQPPEGHTSRSPAPGGKHG